MLIEKGLSENDVVSIKLINGDEIIARYLRENSDQIVIAKPLAVTIGPQGLGMIPWVFLANKEEFTINKSHFFIMVPSKKDAADQYVQGTTGIALS